jgi:hypothetical protein
VNLPVLLAGPILRRTEPTAVALWLATSEAVEASARVLRLPDRSEPVPAGSGRGRTVRLGPRLWVHLVTVAPDDAASFPVDELLAYDIALARPGSEPLTVRSLGLLSGPVPLRYGDLPLPTFCIRGSRTPLNLLHGSCRLLHGAGEDALVAADETIERCARDVDRRPSGMFLTGDQIYADDVAAAMIRPLRALATELMGPDDDGSVPGVASLSALPVDGRDEIVRERARFSSDRAGNHLMSFGEFAAMYLLAWNEAMWPPSFPSVSELPGRVGRRKYATQRRNLEAARRALPRVRRVLANTPTYTNFDDHDTTDDWNLTQAWRTAAHDSPTGRRVIAHALASYWAFQGWGNAPRAFDDAFIDTVAGFLSGDRPDGDAYDSLLWSFERWSYTAPTDPPTLVLDTRTQRDYDSPEGAARLLGERGRRRAVELVRAAGHRRGEPLAVVSAVPVFGFELQERRQKYLVDKLGPYEIDFEAWHSNLRGLVDLMKMLVEDIQPSSCLLLSGDVHYGVNARASFVIEDKTLLFTQLVSSGQKHAGAAAKTALNTLGRLLRRKHERLGWDSPPECRRHSSIADRIMLRAVNSDEWAEDSPVFLAPRDVKVLGVDQPPDFRECRIYVRPKGRNSSILVGENNTGLVRVEGDEITHRLLVRGKHGSREHVATIVLGLQELE